jgi:hypothetical protein
VSERQRSQREPGVFIVIIFYFRFFTPNIVFFSFSAVYILYIIYIIMGYRPTAAAV